MQATNIESLDNDVRKDAKDGRNSTDPEIDTIYFGSDKQIFEEEAEQSRLMTAISAGEVLILFCNLNGFRQI